MGSTSTACRGVRGATTVDRDASTAVDDAVGELLAAIQRANGLRPEDVASAVFTVTSDLPGANPAAAARSAGWDPVPFLVVGEHAGPDLVPRCIRVLLLWNTPLQQSDVRHVYLRGARELRPDLSEVPGAPGRIRRSARRPVRRPVHRAEGAADGDRHAP